MSIQHLSTVPPNMQMISKSMYKAYLTTLKVNIANRFINRNFAEIHSLYQNIKWLKHP
ncbi:unnamed protein product [Trichobilharzia regenti]|nr:unnamed protein product [Trichobilharzia regenti]